MKDSTASVSMIVGRWYKIRHRAQGERYDRMSVMQYLGLAERPGAIAHRFSARPVAGTQTLPHTVIVSVQEVPATTTPIVAERWVSGPDRKGGARKGAAGKAAK